MIIIHYEVMKNNIYSIIIESMSDGLLVLNFQGYITHINRAGLTILGLELEEIEKKTYVQLFMGEPDNDEFNDILFAGIQNNETRLYKEVPYRKTDGSLIDLAVTTSFLRDETGNERNSGIVVVFKDITEFKALNRARERVLDHLSHELRTPLSIISATLKRLKSPENIRSTDRISRNLERLIDIQVEVEDIIKRKEDPFNARWTSSPDQILDLLEVLEEAYPVNRNSIQTVSNRIKEYFLVKDSNPEGLSVGESILHVIEQVKQLSSHRDITLKAEIKEDTFISIENDVLEKVFIGIIKNAIENTPDGGSILVTLSIPSDTVKVEIKDTGTGITEESQRQIFRGFYHARETDLYSTKNPFDFGAGGKGLDLLRIKIFADLYHFKVECFSNRCKFIPGEENSCPGKITDCQHIKNKEECTRAGGTTFRLSFPTDKRIY